MTAEDKCKDIITLSWKEEVSRSFPGFFCRHPHMPLENRAKIFAPFAALRGHGDRLSREMGKLLRDRRTELSEEEAGILSDKLLQIRKGMTVTVVYFRPDPENGDFGCNISVTGTASNVDPVSRILKISSGKTGEKGGVDEIIRFDDLLDIKGEEIVDIDDFLGL